MKKQFFFFSLLVSGLFLTSCDKLIEHIFKTFEAPIEFHLTLHPVVAGIQGSLGNSVVSYDLESTVRENTQNQVGADLIQQIYVKDIRINVSNADSANKLGNFEMIAVVLSDTLGTVTIGPFQIPASTSSEINLPVSNSPNIRRFFNGDDVAFNVIGLARTSTTIALNAEVQATLKFDK